MNSLIRDPFGEPIVMRQAYGEALVELGRKRKEVVVLSADVSSSDFSWMFEAAFPDRFFNVGIAEPALVDVSVGLANTGRIPIANTFAIFFATRAIEMIRTHLCYGKANVKLAGAYAGLSDSFDGPTHHSITDIAMMRSLPGMTVVVPSDPLAVTRLLPQVVDWNGPVYFRLCRNEVPQVYSSDAYQPVIGKGITLIEGSDVTLIVNGILVSRAITAIRELARIGVSARLVEIHTVKPLDADLILQCAMETRAIVTIEEHSIVGGLGGAVAEHLSGCHPVPVVRVGLDDCFAETGPYPDLLDKYGMSVDAMVNGARRAVERKEQACA
jgi:transketolase